MEPNKDFEEFNEEIEVLLGELGHWIGDKMPEGWGFNLLLFSFGEKGSMFYISNAQRTDMIEAMKEFIQKQEGKK